MIRSKMGSIALVVASSLCAALVTFTPSPSEAGWGIRIEIGGKTVLKADVEEDIKNPGNIPKNVVRETVQKPAETVVREGANAAKEAKKVQDNVDKAMTKAWEDFVTEANYFGATVCGESSKAKNLARKYNQKEISREEYERELEKIEKSKGCSFGGGYDSNDGAYLLDKNGQRVPKPPSAEDNVAEPLPEPRDPEPKEDGEVVDDVDYSIVKPPFERTPLGHELSYPNQVTDVIPTTPTPGNPQGGEGGYTRYGGSVYHSGVDVRVPDGKIPQAVQSKWYGVAPGTVTEVRTTREYGTSVFIQTTVDQQTWISMTTHHGSANVKAGDVVQPGQVYANGAGYGDQFKTNVAGDPHVHWRLYRVEADGSLTTVRPNDGLVMEKKKK